MYRLSETVLQLAAIADAPKNDAVTMPSILPLDLHNFSACNILGTISIAPTSKATNTANIFKMRNVISTTLGVILPVWTIVVTTDNTAIASMSSTIRQHPKLI